MNAFGTILKSIAVKASDVEMFMIMGTDGILVEKYVQRNDPMKEQLSSEFAALLHSQLAREREISMGKVKDIYMKTQTVIMMATSISDEYYLFATMNPGVNIGRARYAVKYGAKCLLKEI